MPSAVNQPSPDISGSASNSLSSLVRSIPSESHPAVDALDVSEKNSPSATSVGLPVPLVHCVAEQEPLDPSTSSADQWKNSVGGLISSSDRHPPISAQRNVRDIQLPAQAEAAQDITSGAASEPSLVSAAVPKESVTVPPAASASEAGAGSHEGAFWYSYFAACRLCRP
jgi:hypothetical protein